MLVIGALQGPILDLLSCESVLLLVSIDYSNTAGSCQCQYVAYTNLHNAFEAYCIAPAAWSNMKGQLKEDQPYY